MSLPGCTCFARSLARNASRNRIRAYRFESTWRRAVQEGKLPAYDEALKFLEADKQDKLKLAQALEGRIATCEDAREKTLLQEELEEMRAFAEINDPQVRFNFNHGNGDMSKPVYRKLYDAKWRKEGALATLMLRLQKTGTIPDLLPSIDPTVDLIVKSATGKVIKPDTLVDPAETISEVQVDARILHGREALYTLVLVDPDVPNTTTEQYDTYCHLLSINIPLSGTASRIGNGQTLLPYIPPHPQRGTPTHRYVYVLLEQSSQIPQDATSERNGFNLRQFIKQHDLTPVGINFFRGRWSDAVTTIYHDILNEPEPQFASRMPRVNLEKILRQSGPIELRAK